MKKLVAALLIATSTTPVLAGPITESAFSAQTTIDNFDWAVFTDNNTVSHNGVDFTTTPGGQNPAGGFRGIPGAGRDGSNALYDTQGTTNLTIALNGAYERVGVDVNIGPASYVVSFYDSASNLLGAITGTNIDTTSYFFAGFESAVGIASLTIRETSGDNGYIGGIDNLRLDAADVPEPAMLGLFGLGAIGLGLSRRRKA